MANVGIYCCCAPAAPCSDCNSAKLATVAGITGDAVCTARNTTWAFGGFGDLGSTCAWFWSTSGANATLWFQKTGSKSFPNCGITVNAGQFFMQVGLTVPPKSSVWEEIVTGFSCDPATGRVSGTYTFNAPCNGVGCAGNLSFTVLP